VVPAFIAPITRKFGSLDVERTVTGAPGLVSADMSILRR
jgi:hypothetical protein